MLNLPETPWPVKQPYDAFLVLDVEATCEEGTDFNWPNEIIVSIHLLVLISTLCHTYTVSLPFVVGC